MIANASYRASICGQTGRRRNRREMSEEERSYAELMAEAQDLRARLQEAERGLHGIRMAR